MGKTLAGVGVLLLSFLIVGVLIMDSAGTKEACNPAASAIDPTSVPEVASVQQNLGRMLVDRIHASLHVARLGYRARGDSTKRLLRRLAP